MTHFVIALGNPGEKYLQTRHNVGQMMLEKFRQEKDFPEWKNNASMNALFSEGMISGQKVILVMSQEYMNNSGRLIGRIVRSYKDFNLIIVHDDVDLVIGNMKISHGRGSAGHKGVQSIIDQIKSKNFSRVRIGIGRNSKNFFDKILNIDASKFVLKDFSKKEKELLEKSEGKMIEVLESIISFGVDKAMNDFN